MGLHERRIISYRSCEYPHTVTVCLCVLFCLFSIATTEEINHAIAGAMIRIVFLAANLYGTGQIILRASMIVSLCFEVSQQ